MGLQRFFTLATLLLFGFGLRAGFDTIPGLVADSAQSATVAVGFLLLAAVVAGQVTSSLGLPRITGYIVLGLVVGPSVLGIVTEQHVAQLSLIDDIAISLIALSAGGELKI